MCWPAHAVPNSTSGPHLAPYPLSRFSRAVPPRLVALLHAVSRFIRIFAPGDVTLSCLGEEGGRREERQREENRAVSRKLERETRRGHEETGRKRKGFDERSSWLLACSLDRLETSAAKPGKIRPTKISRINSLPAFNSLTYITPSTRPITWRFSLFIIIIISISLLFYTLSFTAFSALENRRGKKSPRLAVERSPPGHPVSNFTY